MASITSILHHSVGTTAGIADVDAWIAGAYDTYREELAGFARLCIGDRSAGKDLAHEVFLDLLAKVRRDPHSLQGTQWPWLHGTLVYRVINRRWQTFRESGRLMRVYDGPREEDSPWSGEAFDFQRALATLPPKMRACAVLRFVEDQSMEDIATAVG